ncbi:MAG TPA: NAD(P)-dependent oxidoreductase [Lysobacter sp.]|nr:NAD(P)-dependent oxidoreductase [Lysobacter sp.]
MILGASGFIGRKLASASRAAGIETTTLTSKVVDLAQPESSARLADMLKPSDSVVMLAAAPVRKGRDTEAVIRNLILGESTCRAVARANCAHVVYVSSDSVYPFGPAPITEADMAAPTYLYAAMHATRELMFREAVKTRLAIVRPTQIYGADDTHNAYGPCRMFRSALADGKIALFEGGEEMRDHLYIDDLVWLLVQVVRQRGAGVLNLATGRSVTFEDLARRISALIDRPIEFVTQPREKLTITHRHFDISALRRALPDFAATPLDEGLARMLAELETAGSKAAAAS